MKKEAAIKHIADEILKIEILETRNMDDLDFHSLSVEQIKQALSEAFDLGMAAGKNSREDEISKLMSEMNAGTLKNEREAI